MTPAQPDLSDRLLSGALAIVIMGVMVTALPLVLGALTRNVALPALTSYLPLGHGGGSLIVAASAIAAFLLGTERTTALFGHLWGTEEPRKLWLTLALWMALALLGLAGNRLFG